MAGPVPADGRRGARPSGDPGRSSSDASAPTRARRLVGVGRVEQAVDGHVEGGRVAVPGLPVGEGELGALGHRVDVAGAAEAHRRQVEALQQRAAAGAGPGPGPTARSCRPSSRGARPTPAPPRWPASRPGRRRRAGPCGGGRSRPGPRPWPGSRRWPRPRSPRRRRPGPPRSGRPGPARPPRPRPAGAARSRPGRGCAAAPRGRARRRPATPRPRSATRSRNSRSMVPIAPPIRGTAGNPASA